MRHTTQCKQMGNKVGFFCLSLILSSNGNRDQSTSTIIECITVVGHKWALWVQGKSAAKLNMCITIVLIGAPPLWRSGNTLASHL